MATSGDRRQSGSRASSSFFPAMVKSTAICLFSFGLVMIGDLNVQSVAIYAEPVVAPAQVEDEGGDHLRSCQEPCSTQTQIADLDGDRPVYVERDGQWLRAKILYGFADAVPPVFTVQYHDDRSIQEDVPIHRIQHLEAAIANGLTHQPYRSLNQAAITEMLGRHNYWRALIGIPVLTWSDDLADFAQDWADELARREVETHNPNNFDYGENIATGSSIFLTPYAAVNRWSDDYIYYDYPTNSCEPTQDCGPFTQIIWAETTEVGCGMVRNSNGWEVWVCNYNPAGNYPEERPF